MLADGILYAAAGIWPSEGVFIYAVDPATGKTLWCNDSSGSIEMNQPHPTARAKSGVAAQGYLATDGRELLVPTGRAVPAIFDRKTGALKSFALATYQNRGGADVAAFDSQFVNHGLLFNSGKSARPQSIGTQMAVHPRWIVGCKRDRLMVYDRARLWVSAAAKDAQGAMRPPLLSRRRPGR